MTVSALRVGVFGGMCAALLAGAGAHAQVDPIDPPPAVIAPGAAEWVSAEAGTLTEHVQLTFPEQFVKAGEAYFSPTGRWIIFQAVAQPLEGESESPFYSMYVAKLRRDENGGIVGCDAPILISEPGSSNTCGYFHPTQPWRVIFGSTLSAPVGEASGGYQRGTSRYRWAFPDEMEVVWRVVPQVFFDGRERGDGAEVDWAESDTTARPLFERAGYDAECAFSPDGRNVVYAHVDPETQDSDLHVYDMLTRIHRPLVVAKGYDGGPFFSPDGAMICYRSDRGGNDLLQVYIGVLAFDDTGAVLGVTSERAVTENAHVNWAPYWHPWQNYLVYATSEMGHANYEVFATEVPVGILEAAKPAELKRRRITHAAGFDGLPVFSHDGKHMMWTSQRGAKHAEEERPSSQIWVARVVDASPR